MYTFILGEYHMIAVSESIARDVGKSGNTAVSSLVYLKGGGAPVFISNYKMGRLIADA